MEPTKQNLREKGDEERFCNYCTDGCSSDCSVGLRQHLKSIRIKSEIPNKKRKSDLKTSNPITQTDKKNTLPNSSRLRTIGKHCPNVWSRKDYEREQERKLNENTEEMYNWVNKDRKDIQTHYDLIPVTRDEKLIALLNESQVEKWFDTRRNSSQNIDYEVGSLPDLKKDCLSSVHTLFPCTLSRHEYLKVQKYYERHGTCGVDDYRFSRNHDIDYESNDRNFSEETESWDRMNNPKRIPPNEHARYDILYKAPIKNSDVPTKISMEENIVAAKLKSYKKLTDNEILDWAKKIKHEKRLERNKIKKSENMDKIVESDTQDEEEIQEVKKIEEKEESVISYKGIDGINENGTTPKPIPGIETEHQELIVQKAFNQELAIPDTELPDKSMSWVVAVKN